MANTADGFTLIELLITVAVLTILMAIATASYDALKANVRFSKVKGGHGRDRQSGVKRLQHEQHLGPPHI